MRAARRDDTARSGAPHLAHLMGAYFHQDWDLNHADEWAVLSDFIQKEPHRARPLAAEIDQVLAELGSEEELKRLVIDQLGGYFLADWDGGTYRGWLTEMARRVRGSSS